MPFTLAHAAAALPLRRLPLVPSALVVGTFAPDFEYFLLLAPRGGFGHTIPGAFLLSLPIALVVLFIFHAIVKIPVTRLLPDPIRLRIETHPFRFAGSSRFLLIVISTLIGIATHILWDSFTHRYTWLTLHWPLLRQTIYLPLAGWVAYYQLLQQGSSIFGMLVLYIWLAHWYKNTSPRPQSSSPSIPAFKKWSILSTVAMVALLGTGIRLASTTPMSASPRALENSAAKGVITAIAVAWWQIVAYSLFVAVRRAPSQQT